MELIHAGEGLSEIRELTVFGQWDLVSSLKSDLTGNDFELSVSESIWLENPILKNHFLYEPSTEWGGRVEGVRHVGSEIKLSGLTWRGMLARKIIQPPFGQSYFTVSGVDANEALGLMVGDTLGSLFEASSESSGITVSGSFKYANLLTAITKLLTPHNARLNISFENNKVVLSAALVRDLTDSTELSQDYYGRLETEQSTVAAYNHIIALGSGSGINRQVVHLYRSDSGVISDAPITGIEDKQIVFDYPNAEDLDDLTEKATDEFDKYLPVENITIDLSQIQDGNLGDIVGGRDYVTGMSISKPISQIIRTVKDGIETIQYTAGE